MNLRVGTLEMTVALLAVAIVAIRPRVRAAVEVGRLVSMRVLLEAFELAGTRVYEGRPPFDVGRDPEADLVLKDPEVSRRHARFESRNGAIFVGDLSSRNGSFLNGRRIREPIEVREGDALDVGTTRIVVKTIAPVEIA